MGGQVNHCFVLTVSESCRPNDFDHSDIATADSSCNKTQALFMCSFFVLTAPTANLKQNVPLSLVCVNRMSGLDVIRR